MKKLLILCALLLAALLSGCAAEPSQRQSTANTPKASTPQEETSAFFEPVSTESSTPAKAPAEAADPAACIPNEDKHDSSPSFSSEPVSAPTESNAPTPEEDRQAPVLPEKSEKTECPKEEPSVPAITEPEPTGCQHDWICVRHEEEGHWIAGIVCDCGWTVYGDPSALLALWNVHSESFPLEESLFEHGGCGCVDEWVVDVLAWEEWYCSLCGEAKP